MADDDPVDPRLLVQRDDERIQQLAQDVEELRSRLDALSGRGGPDLSLYDQNISALAKRATDLEEFNKGWEGQDGISVHGNKVFLDRKDPRGDATPIATEGDVSDDCPFDVILAADSGSPGDFIATLIPGSLNQLVPTNCFDDFSVAGTGTFYVKVSAVSDGTKITSSTIVIDGSQAVAQTPVPFALPSTLELLVGIIQDGVAYRTIPCGSLTRDGREIFRTDKSPAAAPGELTYIPYFVWSDH